MGGRGGRMPSRKWEVWEARVRPLWPRWGGVGSVCAWPMQPPTKLTELLMIANNVQNSSGNYRWLIAQPTPPNLK